MKTAVLLIAMLVSLIIEHISRLLMLRYNGEGLLIRRPS